MHQSHGNGPTHMKFAIPDRYGACPAGVGMKLKGHGPLWANHFLIHVDAHIVV